MDVRSLFATQSYAQSQKAAAPGAGGAGQALRAAATSFEQTLRNSDRMTTSAFFGTVDPHLLVTSLAQTELAVQATVAVRDKVVEAYQEILRMPV